PIEAALQAASQLNSLDINIIANLNLPEPVELITKGESPLTESAFLLPQITKFVTSLDHLYQKSFSYEELTRFRVDSVDYEPVYFKLDGVTLGVAIEKMESLKKKYNLGDTDLRGMGGIQNMQETFSKMTVALLISLALTILILMLQFKSAVQTSIIMLSIPLSVGGAVMGLLLLRETVNISVMVGFILLGGIIVNNGILLMEAINQGIEGGLSLVESIETAVTNRTRPILMTSVSAIAGMLPTLLFESEGQELYRGMAIVNIFGMAFGTVLTLVVVPVICWIFLRSQHEKS
ncbi:MAG TPA: efflux RND transporter permease subunit, partial [Pseudobdellovibrionaceae bacterium]|nr:efflux RND transporter permease subunit [Pseudobdellovibrionaceae bacterium]